MANKNQEDVAAENGKPSKSAAPPVIRRLVVAEEDSRTRILKKQLPAWVISGGIHVLLILFMVVFFNKGQETQAKQEEKIITTAVEEPKDKQENFTEPDLGFDADLKAATESPREEAINVEAPTAPEEAIGAPNQETDVPTQTFSPMGFGMPDQTAGLTGEKSELGKALQGMNGGGSQFSAAGLRGRSGATKDALVRAGGGNTESEAAVTRGLIWLQKQQKADGRWQYDGATKDDIAATGMALLPFLAAGQTHKSGGYIKVVSGGLTFLVGKQKPTGDFTGMSGMYSHAIAAVALCEAYGMTQDPTIKARAQAAVNYIVRGQAGNGSWGYSAGTAGDTSIVGWQIQAIKSGRLCGLVVPDAAFKKANEFLESVSMNSGANYGYSTRGASPTLTPVGLLCRYYLGWGPKNPSLNKGVEYLLTMQPRADYWDMYYYYYATQVVHFVEGPAWYEKWNPKMRDMLIKMQVKTNGQNLGSWDKDNSHIGSSCGRLGTTCLALLTLEVYYRHLPLYKRGDGGLAELER